MEWKMWNGHALYWVSVHLDGAEEVDVIVVVAVHDDGTRAERRFPPSGD